MEKPQNDSRNMQLKTRVKTLIKKANDNNLIKSHVLAYKDTPVELEHHKGNLRKYKNKGE